MKVFEVTTEYFEDGRLDVITRVQYVTSEEGTVKAVMDYFMKLCDELGHDLKGVREVLTIVQHIERRGEDA